MSDEKKGPQVYKELENAKTNPNVKADPAVEETRRVVSLVEKTIGMKLSNFRQLTQTEKTSICKNFGKTKVDPSMTDQDKQKTRRFLFAEIKPEDQRVVLQDELLVISEKIFGSFALEDLIDALSSKDTKTFIDAKAKGLSKLFGGEESARQFVSAYVAFTEKVRKLLDNMDRSAPGGYGPYKDQTLIGDAGVMFFHLSELNDAFSEHESDISARIKTADLSTYLTTILGIGQPNVTGITIENSSHITDQIGILNTTHALVEEQLLNPETKGLPHQYVKTAITKGVDKGAAFLSERGYGQLWNEQYAKAQHQVSAMIAGYYRYSVPVIQEMVQQQLIENIAMNSDERNVKTKSGAIRKDEERAKNISSSMIKLDETEEEKIAKGKTSPKSKKTKNIAEEHESGEENA